MAFVDCLNLTRLDLYTRFDMLVDSSDVDRLRGLITRRGRREPLAYILGTQPFCGLELQVDKRVLVPRIETEQLVELALSEIKARNGPVQVIDVGTGSGAIALALAHTIAQGALDASVSAVDVSEEALAVARANAASSQLHCDFFTSDLLAQAPGLGRWW